MGRAPRLKSDPTVSVSQTPSWDYLVIGPGSPLPAALYPVLALLASHVLGRKYQHHAQVNLSLFYSFLALDALWFPLLHRTKT